jgi:hypothetical protein
LVCGFFAGRGHFNFSDISSVFSTKLACIYVMRHLVEVALVKELPLRNFLGDEVFEPRFSLLARAVCLLNERRGY